jgi:hypothetical protein
MNRPLLTAGVRKDRGLHLPEHGRFRSWGIAGSSLVFLAITSTIAAGQAVTIDKQGNVSNGSTAPVDRRYAQVKPTDVPLPKSELDAKTRQDLIRLLQAEQGFAMRPFPRGHKGLTLVANGALSPAGGDYLDMVTAQGICAKPGDRVVFTDVKIDHDKIVFDLNGGPDAKHRFLRHIQIGAGNSTAPVVQDDGQQPAGARLTLDFKGHIPQLTGAQVKALLAPLISFDVKTPIEAFTDTLPPKLKDAILGHHVMVGMSTDMVLFAKGQPQRKTREVEGQMPFEEWIYGQPPKDVEFVRINGNRVIRVEIAKMGEKPVIYTQDEVEGMMRTDGTPLIPGNEPVTHTVHMGDVQPNSETQSPNAPPSLRNPGESIPDPSGNSAGELKPVQFPKQKPDDYPDASKLPRDKPAPADDSGSAPPAKSTNQPAQPQADATQVAPGSSQTDEDRPQ